MSKHTPTPWEVGDTGDGWNISATLADANGVRIHRVARKLDSEADAAYIVRAVNAHEQLVEALRDVLSVARNRIQGGDVEKRSMREQIDICNAAAAALRAAGVEP